MFKSKLLFYIAIIISLSFIFSCKTTKVINGIPFVSNVKGDTIFLKSGVMKISQTIVVPENTVLIGDNTELNIDDLQIFPAIKVIASKNVVIKNISIVGEKIKLDKYKIPELFWAERNNFLQILNCRNVKIDNCHFKNSYGSVVLISDSHNIDISNCSIKEVGLPTYHTYNYSYDGILIGGYQNSSKININNCKFINIGRQVPRVGDSYANDGDGVQIQSVGEVEDITIKNCFFKGCDARGVKVMNGKNIIITNNEFEECGASVCMAIVKNTYNVDLSNNNHKNVGMAYSSETMGEDLLVDGLKINDNYVAGEIAWFMRTGGRSSVINAEFNNNTIEDSGLHVFAGRFYKSKITNNVTKSFGSRKYIYHMALEIAPECYDLTIENNYFGKYSDLNFEMTNYSKNNTVVIRNNIVEFSKTKREKN